MSRFAWFLLAPLLGAGGPPASEDQIHLRGGKVIAGTIKAREKDWVEILVAGRPQRIPRSQIVRITDPQGRIGWADAYRFETAHYTFTTNLPRERADALAARLEGFYSWFLELFGPHWKLRQPKRMGVQLFRTRKEFLDAAWEPHKAIMPVAPGGFYLNSTETLFLPDESLQGGTEDTDELLFHEGGHQILHLAASLLVVVHGGPQHWIVEGLPCVFEGLDDSTGKLVLGIAPDRVLPTIERMRAGKSHSLVALDALTSSHYQADEYGEGYCLAYFFMTAQAGSLRKPFVAYVREVMLTRSRPGTFKRLFGKELSDFEAPYREFVLSLEEAATAARGRRPRPGK